MQAFPISQAAEVLGVSPDTVRRWVDTGKLSASRTASGRRVIDGADLARFAEAMAEAPRPGTIGSTSARNRLVGIVTAVVKDTVMAQVDLVCGAHRVVSLMSREAADELGLAPGVLAVATVKATNVVVGSCPAREGAIPAVPMRRVGIAVVIVVVVASMTSCGSTGEVVRRTPAPPDLGDVDVLYAGSLIRLMEQDLGPRFTEATGYRFVGFSAGSVELANEIKSGVRQGDVLVSASPAVDATLEGEANGDWTSWYASFARVPLVLGYNPHSRFAGELRTRPWYDVVTSSGFLLGRTDPTLDPKGALSVEALRQVAGSSGNQGLLRIIDSTSGVFPEETLLGRLQAGQLDAGFFYANEAHDAGIPTVALTPVSLWTTFTVTVLDRASHPSAGVAFARFLLSAATRRTLAADGFSVLTPPTLHGTGVPAVVESAARGS